jgi:hypothetical protein
VYPDELCAMKNGAHYNWGLATLSNEVDVRFVALLSLFDRTQGRVGGQKWADCPEISPLDPAAWVHRRELNTMKN